MMADIYIVLAICEAYIVAAQPPKALWNPRTLALEGTLGNCLNLCGPVKISHMPKVMHLVSSRISTRTHVF